MIDKLNFSNVVCVAFDCAEPLLNVPAARAAMGDPGYTAYIHLPPDPSGTRLVEKLFSHVAKTQGFIESIVRARLAKSVTFKRVGGGEGTDIALPDGYVSWLMVLGDRVVVLYNPSQIQSSSVIGCKYDDGDFNSVYEYNRRLAKVFLHECAHAVLHSSTILAGGSPQGLAASKAGFAAPGVGPSEEAEAWLFASVLWGLLVGEYAFDRRKNHDQDAAWLVA